METITETIEKLKSGDEVLLTPGPNDPIHKKPVKAIYSGGYFYCHDTNPAEGPDYWWRDAEKYLVKIERL